MPIGWLNLFEGLFTLGQAALPGINKKGKQLKAWNEATYDTSFYVDDLKEKKAGDLQLLKSIVTEESIEEGSFYRDDIEGVIKDKLHQKHLCIISGPEGRGKSVLSQLIAYDLHKEEGWDVFITKDDWRTEYLKSSIHDFQGMGADRNCLFILEDVHLLSEADLQKLISTFEEIYIPKENLYFLMNMRPSFVKEDLVDLDKDSVINLDDSDNSEFIRHLAALINKEPEKLMINNKPALDASQAGNRRMLFYFFKELQKEGVDSVREEDILTKFSTAYQLGNDCQDELLFLSSLYQFEIPLPEEFLDKESRYVLNKYADLGLCRKLGRFYYMSETTDARCLCKAICKRSLDNRSGESLGDKYLKVTKEVIVKYYNCILSSKEPAKYERDFQNLFKSILANNDFLDVVSFFRTPGEAEKIVRNICPGFILYALSFSGQMSTTEKQTRLLVYHHTRQFLKENLYRINSIVLTILNTALINHYGYDNLIKDMFSDDDAARKFFESDKRVDHLNARIQRELSNLPGAAKIYKAEAHLRQIKDKKDWMDVQNRLKYLTYNESDLPVVISDIKNNACSINPDNLSNILKLLNKNYYSYYTELVASNEMKACVKDRLNGFKYGKQEFYLIGHFYNNDNPDIKARIDDRLNNADENQRDKMR